MTAGPESPVLTVAQAAAYVGLGRSTFYRVAAACGTGTHAIPVVHISPGRRGFLRKDLDAYLARQVVRGSHLHSTTRKTA